MHLSLIVLLFKSWFAPYWKSEISGQAV
jgi:hypothetical protein